VCISHSLALLCPSLCPSLSLPPSPSLPLSLDLPPLSLSLSPSLSLPPSPSAGFSASLYPASKAVKPELFPVIDADGIAKPAILCHVEELVAVGIEEIVIVVQKEDLANFESLFHQPDTPENFNRLPPKAQVYARRVLAMGEKVATLAAQTPRRLPTL